MAKRKTSKKQIDFEAEDVVVERVETIQSGGSTEAWFEKNKKLVLGIIAALILIIGAYIVYKFFVMEPKMKAAKAAIYKAEQQFERDSFALALENPGGGFEGLLDIIDNYSGTPTANLAKLYAGISYLNLGRYEDAISYLESHSPSGDYSPIITNGNLGDAYSEQGDFSKAESYYEKATTAGEDALLTPYYLYKLGLLAKRNGNSGKALSAFKKIKDNYPSSNEGASIDLLIKSVS